MIYYQLNMGRGFVMPLASRRKWLHWVALYLVLMAVAIAVALFQVIDRALYWQAQDRLITLQARALLANHPEYGKVSDYKRSLEAEVSACTRDLEAIMTFGQTRSDIACNLMALVTPLPPGLGLGTTSYDAEAHKFSVEVVMPASLKMEDRITPQKLLALWEKNSCLSKYSIELENSERIRLAGSEVMTWRFSAAMGGL